MVGAPAAYVDVFVDDIVGLAQKHKQKVRRTLLEAADEVFCPLSPTDCSKPPINVPYKRTFGAPDQGQTLDV
jgi:hypothetical protein